MIGSSIYGVAVIDGSLCSRVYGMAVTCMSIMTTIIQMRQHNNY